MSPAHQIATSICKRDIRTVYTPRTYGAYTEKAAKNPNNTTQTETQHKNPKQTLKNKEQTRTRTKETHKNTESEKTKNELKNLFLLLEVLTDL